MLATALARPLALAATLPCWLSPINRNTRIPTAAIGTTTMTTKKVVKRVRKLI